MSQAPAFCIVVSANSPVPVPRLGIPVHEALHEPNGTTIALVTALVDVIAINRRPHGAPGLAQVQAVRETTVRADGVDFAKAALDIQGATECRCIVADAG